MRILIAIIVFLAGVNTLANTDFRKVDSFYFDIQKNGFIRGVNSTSNLLDNLLTYPSLDNIILLGEGVNTNGVGIRNDNYFKAQAADGLSYHNIAGVDSSNNVILSSGNAATTQIRVGGLEANPAIKILNGGVTTIAKAVRIGAETSTAFGGDLDLISSQGTNGQDGTAGIGAASYRSSDIWGSFFYGARYRGTYSAPTAVEAEDVLSEFGGIGWDGTNLTGGGELMFVVDGSVSSGVIPSRADLFVTKLDGTTARGLTVNSSLDTVLYGNLETQLASGIAVIDNDNKLDSILNPATRIVVVDGSRTDSYTANGTSLLPFKTISDAFSAIETEVAARLVGGESRADCKYVVNIVPNVYTENISIPSVSFLQLNMSGVKIVGSVTRVVSQVGFSGSYYSKVVFNGPSNNRAEKGGQAGIFGDVLMSTHEGTSYLYYTAFNGIELAGNVTAQNGVSVIFMNSSTHYDSTKTILGTGSILLEMSNKSRIKALLSGDVACYNCSDSELNKVAVAPTSASVFKNMDFSGTMSFSSNVLSLDSVSYSSLMSNVPTLTGATVQLLDQDSAVANNSTVTGTTVKDALNTLDIGKVDLAGDTMTGTLEASAGVVLNTTGTQPTCDSSVRGMMWYVQGATGVADAFQICMKDASDVYAWVNK